MTLKIIKSSSVGSIARKFKEEFKCTLRIYKGKRIADDSVKISELTKKEEFRGELKLGARSRVGNVEDYFKDEFGITVQVANPDNTKLADNAMTLAQASKM